MKISQKVMEEAVASLRHLPFDTKELYKRYSLDLTLPRSSAAPDGELETLEKQITSGSGLRFDLVNDKKGISTKSKFVKVAVKAKEEYEEDPSGTLEERLGGYITKASESVIEVNVPDGKEAKLNFLLLCGGANLPLGIIVKTGEGSRLDFFEWFGSASNTSSTMAPFHIIDAGKNSRTEINILHNENTTTNICALNKVVASEGSRVRLNAIYNGGNITKSLTVGEAAGKQSEFLANEIVFGHAEQQFDIGTFLLNSSESTKTELKSGAVLKGKSYCILKGYAKVAKNAKGSYSNVEERGMVMDQGAKIQSLPDMSVDCRDVALASHSAATSPIDKEKLFYLMSRGVDETRARRMFVASFLSKYLVNIENDIVKEIAISILLDKLDNNRHSQVPKISAQNFWMVPKERVRE